MEIVKSTINNNTLFNNMLMFFMVSGKMYGLTPNQVHYLALRYTEDDALLYEALDYLERNGKLLVTKKEIGEMYDGGFIDTTWKSSEYPDEPKLTTIGKNLIKTVYNLSEPVRVKKETSQNDIIKFGSELSEVYPAFWDRTYQAQSFKLAYDKSMKKIEGRSDLYNYYYEVIQGNEALHKEIINKIEWAKKMNAPDNTIPKVPEIRQSIMNFVILKAWENIKISGGSDKVKGI